MRSLIAAINHTVVCWVQQHVRGHAAPCKQGKKHTQAVVQAERQFLCGGVRVLLGRAGVTREWPRVGMLAAPTHTAAQQLAPAPAERTPSPACLLAHLPACWLPRYTQLQQLVPAPAEKRPSTSYLSDCLPGACLPCLPCPAATHVPHTVGGVIGFALAFGGGGAVQWYAPRPDFPYICECCWQQGALTVCVWVGGGRGV